jgi:Fe-Mn family superoxide dismutase
MAYEAKDYSRLLGIAGFSDILLNNHFKLYQGYVKNINLVLEELQALLNEAKDKSPEFAELKRRFGWEFNGVRLHEYYFSNLGHKPIDKNSILFKKIEADFGSFEKWKQDFISTGLMRGIGWVILYLDKESNRLFNVWINEHDVGHLSAALPILVMDVFEHAFMLDYQLDKPKYIEAFFNNINWQECVGRMECTS